MVEWGAKHCGEHSLMSWTISGVNSSLDAYDVLKVQCYM